MCAELCPSLQGPDYRLYKSEPELTTVAEVDEGNGEDRSEYTSERDPSGNKGTVLNNTKYHDAKMHQETIPKNTETVLQLPKC